MSGSDQEGAPLRDARADNWVDRFAPKALLPWLKLARIDRPIGIWLLLWPGLWSIMLASRSGSVRYEVALSFPTLGEYALILPAPLLFLWFLIGAVVMRGAGCTFNDIVDRDLDGSVERTRGRPLPSGQVSVWGTWIFLIAQALAGSVVLLQMNPFAVLVGIAALAPIAVYPFMKRITWWPQLFLGIAFNWGALLGWAAVTGSLDPAAIVLYAGCIFWTLGYDTIYAHQDAEDDALIGIKSTAILLGERTRPFLTVVYAAAILLFGLAGVLAETGPAWYAVLAAGALQLTWQIARLDITNPADCLAKFKSNHGFGYILFAATVVGNIA